MNRRRMVPLNFVDFLVAIIVALAAVTVIKKQETAQAGIEPKAEFVVELSWPDMAKSDIDLWFRAPTGELVNFINKQQNLYSLDRDDLGQTNDQILQPDGSYKTKYINREMLTMRGWVPGVYTINVHVYSWKDDAPIEATVRMTRLNPFGVVLERQVTLEMRGQEITIAALTLSANGAITNIDYTPRSLIKGAQQ